MSLPKKTNNMPGIQNYSIRSHPDKTKKRDKNKPEASKNTETTSVIHVVQSPPTKVHTELSRIIRTFKTTLIQSKLENTKQIRL